MRIFGTLLVETAVIVRACRFEIPPGAGRRELAESARVLSAFPPPCLGPSGGTRRNWGAASWAGVSISGRNLPHRGASPSYQRQAESNPAGPRTLDDDEAEGRDSTVKTSLGAHTFALERNGQEGAHASKEVG